MRRWPIHALGLWVAACGPSRSAVELRLDELELPSSGAIVGVFLPGRAEASARVFKRRLPAGPETLARIDPLGEAAVFYLVVYGADLPELADGELDPAPPGAGGIALPPLDPGLGERVHRRAITEGALGPWAAETALPPELRELRFRASVCPCADFGGRAHALGEGGGSDGPGFVVPLSDTEALVSTTSGRLYRIDAASITAYDPPFPLPTRAAVRTRAGVVWLLGEGGQVVRTSTAAELSFVRAPRHPRGLTIQRAELLERAEGSVLITYGQNDVSAFDGQRWVPLHQESDPTYWQVALAVAGPDEVWTARGDRRTLTRLRGLSIDFEAGSARVEAELVSPDDALGQNFSALTHLPGLGVVAGAENSGELYAGDAGGFARLPRPGLDERTASEGAPTRLGTRFYDMAGVGRGLFGVGALGATVQYHPGFGFCGGERLSTDTITRAVPVGRDLVLLTDSEVRPPTAIYAARRADSGAAALCGW